jgi:BirA family biotin operon repressor/biotin-[acetyl-CoA-carboxylase] ligase
MAKDITQTQIDVLNELKERASSFVGIDIIARELEISKTRVKAALRELLNWGYQLEQKSTQKSELRVKYIASPDILFPHEISFGRDEESFGFNIYSFDRVGSTNTLAHKYAERGEAEGTVVIADRQTAGKGRLGRSWHSPARTGAYMSIILRPEILPTYAPGLSLIAAVSVAEAIRKLYKLKTAIKWPNDVLINDKKAAGVLTELSAELDHVRYVIVGIGININMTEADFPGEIHSRATSIRIASGDKADRIALVQGILSHFEARYHDFCDSGIAGQIKAIRGYSSILGKRIRFSYRGDNAEGTAVDIDESGQLLVDLNGERIAISSGEITLTDSY